jgi:hypothetical protein
MLSLKLNNQKVPYKPCQCDFQTQVGIRNYFDQLPKEITYSQSSKTSVEKTNADGYTQNIHALFRCCTCNIYSRVTVVAQPYTVVAQQGAQLFPSRTTLES